jgi:hypothetical protein
VDHGQTYLVNGVRDDIRELNCGVTDPDDLTEPKAAADAPLQIAER